MKYKKIGVFDSGIGGLSILKQLLKKYPAKYFYVADTAHLPYGDKKPEEIKEFTHRIVSFLIKKEIDACVIACHTASAISYDFLKTYFPFLPFYGVVNSVCQNAIAQTKTGHIGIIATSATISRHAHKEKLLDLAPSLIIAEQACPELVPAIEEPILNRTKVKVLLEKYLSPMKMQNIDTLILGCTHYSLIKNEINEFFSGEIKLICAEETIVQDLPPLRELTYSTASDSYFVTGDEALFKRKASLFLCKKITASKLIFPQSQAYSTLQLKNL